MHTLKVSEEEYLEHQLGHVDVERDYVLSDWIPRLFTHYKEYLVGPLLDIGTRNGVFLDELENAGIEAHGLEITDIAKLAQAAGRKVIQGDIQKRTTYPDKYFKSVVMSHVLEHLTDPEAAMREVQRILDGYLIIIVPIQGTGAAEMQEQAVHSGHHTFFEDDQDLVDFVIKSGFRVRETHSDGPWKQYLIATNA